MPNQKVKHIIAKLVGQSTESTLDVYDVDAVHTDKIANNLTTTSSGYVLDARQGKALNDSLNNFKGMVFCGSVGSSTDINTVTTPGFHAVGFNDTIRPNAPSSSAKYGLLYCLKADASLIVNGSVAYQMWFMADRFYIRSMGSEGWNSWRRYTSVAPD